MKFRNMKIIGALLVVLINLLGAQPAKAMNPLEEAYIANLEKYANAVFDEDEKFYELNDRLGLQASTTSAKKATSKNMIRSIDKMAVTLRKLEAFTAPESLKSTEITLKRWVKSYLEYNACRKKVLAALSKSTKLCNEQPKDLRIKMLKYLDEANLSLAEDVARLQAPPTD